MITRIFFFFGIAVLLVELIALVLNFWKSYYAKKKIISKMIFPITLCLGVPLLIIATFIIYPFSDTLKICGFPFAAAAFQYENGQWIDYVGRLTGFYTFLNCSIFFLIPQLVLFPIIKWKEKHNLHNQPLK